LCLYVKFRDLNNLRSFGALAYSVTEQSISQVVGNLELIVCN